MNWPVLVFSLWLLLAAAALIFLASRKRPGAAELLGFTPARVECSWCGGIIRAGCEPVSHGICPLCFKQEMANLGVMSAAEIRVDEENLAAKKEAA